MTQKERTDVMLKVAYAAGRELAFQEYQKESQVPAPQTQRAQAIPAPPIQTQRPNVGYQAPARAERPMAPSLSRGAAPGQFTAPGTAHAPAGGLAKRPQPARIAGRMASSAGPAGTFKPLAQTAKPKTPGTQ